MRRTCSFIFVWLLFSSAAQSPETGLESIRAEELRQKLVYLASPELKGRGNGAPELRVAAEYIADVFQRNGVRPAGDGGGYFQNFEMFTSRLGSGNDFRSGRQVFRLRNDYVPHYLSSSGGVEAGLIFIGYGLSAPHLKFDELAGVNLQGRIAVVLDGNPHAADFASDFNRIHPDDIASVQTKARSASQAGAVGLVVIQNPAVSNYRIADMAAAFRPDYPRIDVPMGNTADPDNPSLPVIVLSESAGRRLVPSLRDLQRRIDATMNPHSLDLAVRATLKVDVQRVSFPTQNVLGLIEGGDPRLREEVVIVGAHYDHDGESDGEIWYGADDNASGTSGLLELAEAFGRGARAPARSILLAAFAGEEKGEIGSGHYADHPVIPLERTVAMLQMDMIGRNEEHGPSRRFGLERETSAANANSVNVIGSTFSPDLGMAIREVNRRIGLDLKFRYDDTPENLMRRSDHWPFVKKRIPALFIHTGDHPDYHEPSDTPDRINYPKAERIVRLVYLAVERLASEAARPGFVVPVEARP